jgi:hypothetical protein
MSKAREFLERLKPDFQTGKKITFHYLHNNEKSPNFGSRYLQDIEPAGRYMIEDELWDDENRKLPSQWVAGTVTFNNPLVVPIKEPLDHKKYLYNTYKKKGKALTRLLLKKGYDGIVSLYSDGSTGEIIDLSIMR